MVIQTINALIEETFAGQYSYMMLLLKLLWLLSTCCGQHLPSPDGSCEPGFVCKSERHCARYLDLRERLDRLNGTAETDYYKMLEKQVKEYFGRQPRQWN